MSAPNSRAARRQHARGGATPPPSRDPMQPIYVGVAVLLVAIIGAFGIMRWQQQRTIDAAVATPSPNPNFTSKPIALVDGSTLGAKTFPDGDTKSGGNGAPIDGIECARQEYTANGFLHIHPHLSLFVNGKQLSIPRSVGLFSPKQPQCIYWTHTHDASGILHVEAPQFTAPGGGDFTLGIFFDIWGEPLTRDNVAGHRGAVVAYVNGAPYDGDLRAIPLKSHQQVVLEVGTPTVPPPRYEFPPTE